MRRRGILRQPMAVIGIGVTLVICVLGLLAPLIAPHNPAQQFAGYELTGPSQYFWAGTDEFGRDLLSRILYGLRLSLLVGVGAAALSGFVGVLLGVTSGFLGGWLDRVVVRVSDALLVFPEILVGAAIAAAMGPGTVGVILAASLGSLPAFARVSRASVLREREMDYVQAAEALGAPVSRIILRHILPNILPALLVQVNTSLIQAIHLETALSFIGIGVSPPNASLGSLLSYSRDYLSTAWWYGTIPGLWLALLLIGLTYLSDTLRDLIDPFGKR
jgi:peptide/nickel transport system permease protein